MNEHYKQYGVPAFYLNPMITDKEGLREKLEEEKAMLERDMLSIQNTKLRIASLEDQLNECS